MPKPDHASGYVPNDRYTQEDWDEVSDNPELTDEELARMRPAREVLPPELYEALVNRGGRPKAETRKVQLTLRLDPAVVEAYRATGPGWQTRMNDTLSRGARRLTSAKAR